MRNKATTSGNVFWTMMTTVRVRLEERQLEGQRPGAALGLLMGTEVDRAGATLPSAPVPSPDDPTAAGATMSHALCFSPKGPSGPPGPQGTLTLGSPDHKAR